MQEIIIAITIGIAVGWIDILGYKTKLYLNRFSTACLFVMLICLGAKIGCDDKLLMQIERLGWQSLILGSFTIIGSMAGVFAVTKIFKAPAAADKDGGEE